MIPGSVGARFGVAINRLFGLGEQGGPIDVVPEVLPVYDLTADRYEYLASRSERRFVKNMSRALNAAQFSFVGVKNPKGSGRCIVIEQLHRAGASQEMFLSLRRPAEGTLSTNPNLYAWDSRNTREGDPFGMDYDGAGGVGGNTDFILYMIQGTTYDIGVTLAPDSSFHISGNAINLATGRIGFIGYTRPCTKEEMNVG